MDMDPEWVYQCVLEYFVRHKSSWTEIVDIIKLINKIFKKSIIPESKYHFLKKFKQGTKASLYMKCKNKDCKDIHEIKTDDEKQTIFICKCGEENYMRDSTVMPVFVNFAIEEQIKNLVEKYANVLIIPNNFQAFPMTDVWNGKLHRDVAEKEPNGFLSLTLNTDGMEIYNSSKTSLWPIILSLNNLPLRCRFLQDNLIVSGFHYNKQLDMAGYLKPLLIEIRAINKKGGIEFKGSNLKVFILLSSFDAPAKAKVQNAKQFNAHYGCSYCKEPGVSIEKSMKYTNV